MGQQEAKGRKQEQGVTNRTHQSECRSRKIGDGVPRPKNPQHKHQKHQLHPILHLKDAAPQASGNQPKHLHGNALNVRARVSTHEVQHHHRNNQSKYRIVGCPLPKLPRPCQMVGHFADSCQYQQPQQVFFHAGGFLKSVQGQHGEDGHGHGLHRQEHNGHGGRVHGLRRGQQLAVRGSRSVEIAQLDGAAQCAQHHKHQSKKLQGIAIQPPLPAGR